MPEIVLQKIPLTTQHQTQSNIKQTSKQTNKQTQYAGVK
jgi:hypothetical protein